MTLEIYAGSLTSLPAVAGMRGLDDVLDWGLWARPQSGTSVSEQDLSQLAGAFDPLRAAIWHASSGASTSARIRDYKRAFGDWPHLARCVMARDTRQSEGEERSRYADVALPSDDGYGDVARLLNLTTAGANCTLAFIPPDEQVVQAWTSVVGGLTWL